MNSRDALQTPCIQASLPDARCEQARDPAVTGAGCSDLRDARRSFPSPRVQGVICALDVTPSLNCAGSLTGAGGFFGMGGC
jgi:hypothetical protein